MDWTFLYSVPSLLVGLAAGFQGIAERYEQEAYLAIFTPPAFFYLLTRGIFACLLFITLWYTGYIQNTIPAIQILLYSAACGVAEEAVLRTRFSLRGGGKPGLDDEEWLRGPFDLVKWYQNHFLKEIGKHLPRKRLDCVNRFVRGEADFSSLCQRVQANIPALTDPEVKQQIENGLSELKRNYSNERNRGVAHDVLERRYRIKLAFLIYDLAGGKETLKALLSSPALTPKTGLNT